MIPVGAIEKGANDGQAEYVRSIIVALKSAVTTRTAVKGAAVRKGKRKGKKEALDGEEASVQPTTVATSVQKTPSILDPIFALLDPVLAIFRPFITSRVIITVLFLLLAYSWVRPSRGGRGVGYPGYTPAERILAYEEMWRREESALWDWLEDRVGLAHNNVYAAQFAKSEAPTERQRVLMARAMAKHVEDERMSERQMDDAIRTTEEKLTALKDAVQRQRGKKV